jgi:type IV fimbrial biogenesis protein FimT
MLTPSRLPSRRSAPVRARARGVTLIELLITVAVLAVGLSLAAPTFRQQVANYRVRSAAESIVNGLNYARAEAVRRNAAVSFTLDTGGPGWTVAQVSPASTLQARSSGEVPGVTAASSTSSLALTFTPTGFVDTSGTRLSQVNLSSSVASTDARRIDIFGAGLIRVCDPGVTASGDPRRC